jgi:SAM-dependent methyltransferase
VRLPEHPIAFITTAVAAFRVARRRLRLARRYLGGNGLEIGALHLPLRVPANVRVRYVDRMDVVRLRQEYPELSNEKLVDVDVIDDGEKLASQPDASVDFIIANHFIEHTEDPLGALASHLRVLRPGGILYMAVPDRRFTFDAQRQPTALEHIVRDHVEGPAWSRSLHLNEWACVVEKVPPANVSARVRTLDEQEYSIHFHVWSPSEFIDFLEYARGQHPFAIEEFKRNGNEFIAILRRT